MEKSMTQPIQAPQHILLAERLGSKLDAVFDALPKLQSFTIACCGTYESGSHDIDPYPYFEIAPVLKHGDTLSRKACSTLNAFVADIFMSSGMIEKDFERYCFAQSIPSSLAQRALSARYTQGFRLSDPVQIPQECSDADSIALDAARRKLSM
jgi:hypothetical protein